MPQLVEYEEGQPFPGTIGKTADVSSPAWPAPKRAREGAPNVLVFVLDDVGFGQLSPYGGLVETPTLDRLAERGLRYTNMNTTALCSPTRGSILTGRNHHTIGLSAITELSMGYPAHNGMMGFEHGFAPEMLLEHGYNTFCLGKWHLTPPEEGTLAGPFTRWPLGRGFERYYGFLGGDTDQWHPDLTHDNHPVEPPSTPEEGYHLNIDLADRAIGFVQDANNSAPAKPFFMYYATGAGHAPHHVEPEWIEKYHGKFDAGWEAYRDTVLANQKEMGIVPADTELTRLDPDVPPWDSLSDDERRMFTRQMETYAGFLSQTDHHFGRIVDYLELIGELDNTLIMVISDNGPSAEGGVNGTYNEMLFFNNADEELADNLEHYDDWGGPNTFPHYSWGWTHAGATPFRRFKRETYRGGVSDPFIVSWPDGISARGEVRDQYCHAIDIVPTILDALGAEPPATIRGVPQSEIQGVTFAHTFDDADALSNRDTQYFEMFGHRAIYHQGWRAVCPFPGRSFAEALEEDGRYFGSPLTAEILTDLDANSWELYHIDNDPSENHNVAAANPDKMREMIDLWYSEADRFGVLPLATGDLNRMNTPRPTISRPRQTFVYQAGGNALPFAASPRVYNRPHSISADVTIPDGGGDGVLLAHGNRHGGYTFFMKDGYLNHVHNYLGRDKFKVTSPDPIPSGAVTLRYEFEPTGESPGKGKGVPGRSQLYVNDELVASVDLPYTVPNLFGIIGLSCGRDATDSVSPEDYAAPGTFNGEVKTVTLDVTGDVIVDDEADINRLMAQQ